MFLEVAFALGLDVDRRSSRLAFAGARPDRRRRDRHVHALGPDHDAISLAIYGGILFLRQQAMGRRNTGASRCLPRCSSRSC